jgi:hypothetical protein
MIMRKFILAFFALAVMAANAVPANAAQGCKVTGWTEGYNGAPIFSCPPNN